MGGLHHGAAPEPENDRIASRNARYGMMLFMVYLVFYSGFVLINAFRPELMDAAPFPGVNLAVVYGLGLIFGALILALVYAWLCRAGARFDSEGEQEA